MLFVQKHSSILISSILILSTSLVLNIVTGDINFDTLRLTQVIFRHGNKEPDKTYPDGVGKLTDVGKKELFDLGIYLRKRYDGFLNKIYDATEISILSSDKDRTIQSAASMAYGLYNEFNLEATWNNPGELIQFEPIPIRTIPVQVDRLLQPSKNCPRRTQIYQQVKKEVGAQFFEDNKEIIEYYAQHGGPQAKSLVDESIDVAVRFGSLHLQLEQFEYDRVHNSTLEAWTMPIYENEPLFGLAITMTRAQVGTLEGQRLYSGSLVENLIENMKSIVNDLHQIKVRLFSAHDQTMQYLLVSLKMDDLNVLHNPPFGSAIIIELHQQSDDWFLKFWFRNDTTVEPYELRHPDCKGKSGACSLEEFEKVTLELIPTNFESECQPKNYQQKDGGNQILVGVEAVAVVVVLLIVVTLVSVRFKWRSRSYSPV